MDQRRKKSSFATSFTVLLSNFSSNISKTIYGYLLLILTNKVHIFSFRVRFRRHWCFTGQQGKGGDHLHLSVPFPLAYKHLEIYLHHCLLSNIFNPFSTNVPLLYPLKTLIDWWCNAKFCLINDEILDFFISLVWHWKVITCEPTNQVRYPFLVKAKPLNYLGTGAIRFC